MASIALEGVSRVYAGGVRALDDVDLEVNEKEFFVLVGPSGCGKTTTLRLIAGFEPVTTGTIRIGDRVVNGLPPRQRDLAMVVQGGALYPHLTVRDNLAFSTRLRDGGWWRRLVERGSTADSARRRRSRTERIGEIARLLGIAGLLARHPDELSGGERQRVALGRALVRQPAALLLDEPLSSLDGPLRVELRRQLKRLHQQSATTILYVTHDQVEALTLGGRIGVMQRGAIQQVGTPQEIYDRPRNRFVAGFIGSPPMSFVCGRVQRADSSNGEDWDFEGDGWKVAIGACVPTAAKRRSGREVLIGIRPEDVRISTAGAGEVSASTLPGRVRARVAEVEPRGDCVVGYFRPQTERAAGGGAIQGEHGTKEGEADGRRASVAARLAAATPLTIGQPVAIEFDVRRWYWFDPRTGENIGLDGGTSCAAAPDGKGRHERSAPAGECRP